MTQHSDQEKKFIAKVLETLDSSAESLDGRTLSKLTQARHNALQARTKDHWRWMGWPTRAILVAATLLFVLMPLATNKNVIVKETAMIHDLDVITDQEGLEFYRDLDFYYWLATENQHAG